MHQVKRDSGELLRFNLDPQTCHLMRLAQRFHEGHSNPVSNSVIVRRALREYLKFLLGLSRKDIPLEVLETKRAAKGVL